MAQLTMLRALVFAVVGLAATAAATHSYAGACPAWGAPPIPADAYEKSYPVYVAPDCPIGCDQEYWFPSVWIYMESNGIEGLQRHDAFCFSVDANGAPYAVTDTILFW